MSGYVDFPLTVYAFHGCDETVAGRFVVEFDRCQLEDVHGSTPKPAGTST